MRTRQIKFGLGATLLGFALFSVAGTATAAGFITVTAQGVVNQVTPDEGLTFGAQVGDVASISATFDPSTLADITAAADAFYGGDGADIVVASLAAPGASIQVTFDGYVFNQDVSEGVDASGLGVAYPYVIYHGGRLWGFDFYGQDTGQTGFFLGLFGEEELVLGQAGNLAGGGDYLGATNPIEPGFYGVISVPEPGAWSMMLVGLCGLGAALRSRPRRSAPALKSEAPAQV